jgi:hypothetical protein
MLRVPRNAQERPGDPRNPQESLEMSRNPQESPGSAGYRIFRELRSARAWLKEPPQNSLKKSPRAEDTQPVPMNGAKLHAQV